METKWIISKTEFLGETTLEVSKENLKTALSSLKEQGFKVLMDLTAVDYITQVKILYWLHDPTSYQRLRIICYITRDEKLPSVSDIWEGASWYERELFDLFGVLFEEDALMKRILMPDDWVGHPLRKDYPLTEEGVQFKHHVKPKIPSETIPYVKPVR